MGITRQIKTWQRRRISGRVVDYWADNQADNMEDNRADNRADNQVDNTMQKK